MRLILSTLIALSLAGTVNAAHAGLADEQDINAGLLVLETANKIRRACPEISGRLREARSYANQLTEMARQRGYSKAEIDAYINDSSEKAKMRARRNAYFQSRGASNLDPASLCRLGRDEIKSGSHIGSFLKVK